MEGHEAYLEAYAANEEDKGGKLHKVCGLNMLCEIGKVECAGGAIDEGDAVEHQAGREEGRQDILGSCLGALLAALTVSDEGGHRHRS